MGSPPAWQNMWEACGEACGEIRRDQTHGELRGGKLLFSRWMKKARGKKSTLLLEADQKKIICIICTTKRNHCSPHEVALPTIFIPFPVLHSLIIPSTLFFTALHYLEHCVWKWHALLEIFVPLNDMSDLPLVIIIMLNLFHYSLSLIHLVASDCLFVYKPSPRTLILSNFP